MPKPTKPTKPSKPTPQGWLMLGVGGDEVGMPGGRAVHWAAAICPDAEIPTVDEVRAAYPEALSVGQTADGQPVTLRALVGLDEDEEPEPEPV